MAKRALLVIDMLKDFIEEGGALYCGDRAKAIVSFVRSRIGEFRASKAPVIFIMDSHAEDDPEFKLFKKHSVEGTEGAELGGGLKAAEGDYMVKKSTYDGYYKSDLGKVLKENGIEKAYLAGVCTSICVMETAGSLSKRGYKVAVYKDGVADLDAEAHDFALKRMESVYGAEII
jgi:nicotinamidase-related amidase